MNGEPNQSSSSPRSSASSSAPRNVATSVNPTRSKPPDSPQPFLAFRRSGRGLVQDRGDRQRHEHADGHVDQEAPGPIDIVREPPAERRPDHWRHYVPDDIWVAANFKENQLDRMRPGQAVTLHIDAYPEDAVRGHVASVQPGSGTAFSVLPAENATGNYVKIVQRVPVNRSIRET
jgi:hypothetical protein